MWNPVTGRVGCVETAEQRDGLPAAGPGSPAGWSRRFVALIIDWIIANVVAVLFAGDDVLNAQSGQVWVPLLCWFVIVTMTTALTGASTGQWLLRIRVVRLDRQRVGLPRAAVRTALIALVVPPLIFDRNRRGLHDMAVNTAAVNAPQN